MQLAPLVEGNLKGPTLLFVQGWPDDASLWDDAVNALRETYRIVRVNLPGYGGEPVPRWGFDTETIVEAFVNLVRELARAAPITLVLHDWGTYWGHVVHHRCPDSVARVAGIDVAPHYRPTPGATLGIVAYQGWLLSAFVLGGRTGGWMTRGLAKLAQAPARDRPLDAVINYPYRNVWADIASGRAGQLTRGYWPTCPLLFVYGSKKRFMFHSPAWIEHVRRVGGDVIEIPSDHWVPRHPSFVPTLASWLERTA